MNADLVNRRITELSASLSRANALLENERLQRIELLNRLVRMESRLVQIMLALNVQPKPRKEAACPSDATA